MATRSHVVILKDDQGRGLRLVAGTRRSGGQADVWRAEGPDGRGVAVKIYRDDNTAAARERAMLQDVARRDPGSTAWLVPLLGHGQHEGRAFLVLEWMPETLASWCAVRPPHARLRALELAVEAVLRLHRSPSDLAGWHVHRDVKPANLLVAEADGEIVVRLADLGLSRRGEGGLEPANTGRLTTGYAPPEQALPLDAPPEESWDVHALAVTVFECLTGGLPTAARQAQLLFNRDGLRLLNLADRAARGIALSTGERAELGELRSRPAERLLTLEDARPWREEDQQALERALSEGSRVEPHAAAALGEALAACLDPDPRRRERTGRPLLRALRQVRAEIPAEPPSAVPPGQAPAPPAPRRWRRAGLAQGLAGAVLVACAAALFYTRPGEPERAAAVAVQGAADAPIAAPTPAVSPTTPAPVAPPRRARVASKAPLEPARVTEPAWVDVTLYACPLGDVAVRVDGQTHRVPSEGLSLRLVEGDHALSWSLPGVPAAPTRDQTVRVTPDNHQFCQDFTDGLCPERACR